ncbi:MAG: hypothetical protein AAB624_04090 [Patescibacteria group bacterium]
MKKHMEPLLKLDAVALTKKRGVLTNEIVENRRGVINGEIQNTQVVKAKRRELARVNTMLNMLSNSEKLEKTEVKK